MVKPGRGRVSGSDRDQRTKMKQNMVVMALSRPAMKDRVRVVNRLMSSEIRWSGLSERPPENISSR